MKTNPSPNSRQVLSSQINQTPYKMSDSFNHKTQKVKHTLSQVEKASVLLDPAQQIFKLGAIAVTDLQKCSGKSNATKAKVVINFAKKATAVATEAGKKHREERVLKLRIEAKRQPGQQQQGGPPRYEDVYAEDQRRYSHGRDERRGRSEQVEKRRRSGGSGEYERRSKR